MTLIQDIILWVELMLKKPEPDREIENNKFIQEWSKFNGKRR